MWGIYIVKHNPYVQKGTYITPDTGYLPTGRYWGNMIEGDF